MTTLQFGKINTIKVLRESVLVILLYNALGAFGKVQLQSKESIWITTVQGQQ